VLVHYVRSSKELNPQESELIRRVFPYKDFRPYQEEAIGFIYEVMKKEKIGLLSSPCGTGKSISCLTAYFMAKEEADGRLLVLTRTRSQVEIYARELRVIRENSNINFAASIFRSKSSMCPLIKLEYKLQSLSYGDFLHYCNNLKEGNYGGTCEFFDQTYHNWVPSRETLNLVKEIVKIGPLMPDEVFRLCEERRLCPYEVTKTMARDSDVIVGNYNYLLEEPIREALLRKTRIQLNKLNCVVDEAHSLPDYALNLLSNELSTFSLRNAMREAEDFMIDDAGVIKTAFTFLKSEGERVYRENGFDRENIIEKDAFLNTLKNSAGLSLGGITDLVSELSTLGETLRQGRVERGESPVSHLARFAEFVSSWMEASSPRYVFYIKTILGRTGKPIFRMGIKCLDPMLATGIISELRSAILMSGTLGDPNYYVDILGIPSSRTVFMELPSPISRENRLILVDNDVTTKFESRDEKMWRKVAEHVEELVRIAKGRTAVYFPSYEIMRSVENFIKLNLPFMVERRDMEIAELFNFLHKYDKGVFFGVTRGKVSEGVDMSLNGLTMLAMVIIVGLPYPKKTELQQAVLKYYEERFGGKAHAYANEVPCANAVTQAAGRLFRSPEDRGVVVLMDWRAAGRFKARLPREWQKEMEDYSQIEEMTVRIQKFFEQ